MEFTKTTVSELFGVRDNNTDKQFIIPVYQRAYSWDEPEWKCFIEDLQEQINSENNYYYGSLLLETKEKNKKFEIIDGQQRLTTITIFMRALVDVLQDRKDDFKNDIEQIKKRYLKNNMLIPVYYDKACYDSIIIDGDTNYNPSSISQKRMVKSRKYFYKYLSNVEDEKLLRFLKVIENAEINCIELDGKKEASLMFELENNRGKDLTNLEKLKSYFMYQMHVNSKKDETEFNIERISNIFENIYSIVNDLEMNEDSILIYHCNAYVNGYDYRTIEQIKEQLKLSTDKVDFIKSFSKDLHMSFSDMKVIENSKSMYFKRMKKLGIPAFVYPFLIKGMKYLKDNETAMDSLYDIMEKVAFRQKLINSRADIKSRLNPVLKSFVGDVEKLRVEIDEILQNAWYWSDDRVKEYLNGYMAGNKVLKYLLYNYENFIQSKGYLVADIEITDTEIEHISPQTPRVDSGYEVNEHGEYSKSFKDEYLNSLGNLVIISKSHNCSIGNDSFGDKLKSYLENPILKQQSEIKDFVSCEDNPIWDSLAIKTRHDKILNFAIDRWSLKK